jgi:hypothetical protein
MQLVNVTSIKTRAKEFWKRNQIIIIHMPITLAALFGCYVVLKSLDPRIGVEGFGDVFGYLLNAVRATLIIYTAWWMKKWLFFDLHDQTEIDLYAKVLANEAGAFKAKLIDRGEWIVALSFATYWLTR